MGYRTYISKISKTRYEELQLLSTKELLKTYSLWDEGKTIETDHLKDGTYLHEFGKYTEFDKVLNTNPYFPNNEEANEMIDNCDTTFCLIDKESLKNIIKHYEDKIIAYTSKTLEDWSNAMERLEEGHKIPESVLGDIASLVSGQANDWRTGNINWGDNDFLTTSWRYEYIIFELVRIYKTFDWENDLLIYEGW